ncbi:MAG TPA: hypothetical protein VFH48_20220 [Chloroflexota bacterium]|nr:hypothetical protein [Chloroflexota bacterium]
MRVLPARSAPYADHAAAPAESAPRHSAVLPAARIALVRFALVEVEQPAEETPDPLGCRLQIHDTDHTG